MVQCLLGGLKIIQLQAKLKKNSQILFLKTSIVSVALLPSERLFHSLDPNRLIPDFLQSHLPVGSGPNT